MNYLPIRSKGRAGIIDTAGVVRVEANFVSCGGGLYPWTLDDHSELTLLDCDLSVIRSFGKVASAMPVGSKFLRFKQDGRVHVYDCELRSLIPHSFEQCYEPAGQLMVACQGGRFGLFQVDAGWLKMPNFRSLQRPLEDTRLFGAQLDDSNHVLVNRQGDRISTEIYDFVGIESEGLIPVRWKTSDEEGWVDTVENTVVAPQFKSVWNRFSGGCVPVDDGIAWGLADRTGELVLPHSFRALGDLQSGRRRFSVSSRKNESELVGYLDEANEVVVPPTYYSGSDFVSGFASVTTGGRRNAKLGWIGVDGHYIWHPSA